MQKIKVAVLRGGPSSEYEVSLKTGKNVLDNLPDKYIPTDVLISKSGDWHVDGVLVRPEKVFQGVDVVFNALHGEYGEDGKLQQMLDHSQVKYTGSGALASAIGMNKIMAKEIFKDAGIKTPVFKVLKKKEHAEDIAHTIFKTFPMPAIIKPAKSGSSLGVSLVQSVKEIDEALHKAFQYSDEVLIEEFISGREATCGIIENFKGEKLYSLLPIEIIAPKNHAFFDYAAKYSGISKEICPGNFSKEESALIQELSKNAHGALGLRHYSRSDFIVHPKRGVYVLEVNTLPGLTKESLIPKSLEAVGATLPQFLDHILSLALEG